MRRGLLLLPPVGDEACGGEGAECDRVRVRQTGRLRAGTHSQRRAEAPHLLQGGSIWWSEGVWRGSIW
eukprot:169464-Pyramimonas_sp.AAC.3